MTLWGDPTTWGGSGTSLTLWGSDWVTDPDPPDPPDPPAPSGTDVPSTDNPTATITTDVVGIWLIEDDYAIPDEPTVMVRLLGIADAPSEIGESSEVVYPIGRKAPVYQVDAVRGYEGTVAGLATSREDRLQLLAWKEVPGMQLRLVMGDMNIPVQLHRMSIGRRPKDRGYYPVEVEVSQIREFDVRG